MPKQKFLQIANMLKYTNDHYDRHNMGQWSKNPIKRLVCFECHAQKNGNKNQYSDSEKVTISTADLPGLPYEKDDWNVDNLKSCVIDAFLKCEIDKVEEDGLVAKVSHSGVGGY